MSTNNENENKYPDETDETDKTDTNDNTQESILVTKIHQLPDDPSYIAHEELIVKTWNTNNLYQKILDKNIHGEKFIFMDGPPFVSGNLHPGHMAVSSVKSALWNYKSMKGFNCNFKMG